MTAYVGVRIEGGVVPPSLIGRVAASDKDLPGNRPEDYHLAATERLGDAASRKWLYLRGAYLAFRDRLARLPETDPATTETREHWLLVLLTELGFGRVPFVRGGLATGEKTYPISHIWERVPIYLLGWHTNLDKRSSKAGRPPQSMLQEFLNVSDDHLWGLLSNGRQLRLVRDSKALTGSSYVEFDLEAIFDGELYSDFLLLFALLHESRFELLPREDGGPSTLADCWLERWRADEVATGTRAMYQLRDSVQRALEELGTGFLEANPTLRDKLADGTLTRSDFRHELLRLAYQLIFLFVAEDRNALFESETDAAATDSYLRYFSTSRLRRIARVRRGDRNVDLWHTLVTLLDALGGYQQHPAAGLRHALHLPVLGGLFFRPEIPNGEPRLPPDLLRDCSLRNDRLLSAIWQLDEVRPRGGRPERVDYLHLGGEELGSVYESLLELEPRHDPAAPRFWLAELPGNARKTTGSYYTPRALIETLLDSTLDPIIERAARSGVPSDLLELTVCDPACGSGQFLVAAARRIAKRYAAMWSGDQEPPPRAVTDAMHDVVDRCIYGVDMNPLAAEMAKISLWIESLTPGKPLVFLDARIKVGNSLLGVTPRLLESGIPDTAFKPIEGDDPKVAASLRVQNQKENGEWVQPTLYDVPGIRVSNARLAAEAGKLAALPVLTLENVREKARQFRAFQESHDLRHDTQVANAWCAAFVWRKHAGAPEAITTETLRKLDAGEILPDDVQEELDLLAQRYRFFHWHLEFPHIFRAEESAGVDGHDPGTGWKGGFDCVVGNPPWEKVELREQEFFAARRDDIADAANAAERKRMIKALADSEYPEDKKLFADYRAELRQSAGWSHLLRESGRYRLTGRGRLNTYAVFAETARTIIALSGRAGLVLPTGIATDATTAPFFGDVVRKSALVAMLEFENEAFLLSRAVHHSFRFCLLSMCGQAQPAELAEFAFGLRYLAELPERRFTLPPGALLDVNPNTGTTPLFRFPRDAEITLGIYRRPVPVLCRDESRENPWGVSFMQGLFNMATDAVLFRTKEELRSEEWKMEGNVFVKDDKRMLPLYEAKMIHFFDHRYGTYEGQTQAQANVGTLPRPSLAEKADPSYVIMPRYWVPEFSVKNEQKSKPGKPVYDAGVTARLDSRGWDKRWLFGWRDVARSSDERTMICSVLPRTAVGHKLPLAFSTSAPHLLAPLFSSFILDYLLRQKSAGTSVAYFVVKQLPVLPPERYDEATPWEPRRSLADWIEPRVLELSYITWDMESFARDLGDEDPPFVWDEKRRFEIRAELDAAFFHLYGIDRSDVDYIMETFPVVRRRDEDKFDGEYRTKLLILKIYDAMADAIKTGVPYQTVLADPPGQGKRHPARQAGLMVRRLRLSPEEAAKAVDEALAGRTDLDQYGSNKRLLFAVQLLLDVADIHSLAADALTDGSDDKACDFVHVDRDAGLVLLAQGTEYGGRRSSARDSKVASLHQAVTWTFAHDVDELPERIRPAVLAVRTALAAGLIREIRVWFVHNLPESPNVGRELDAIRTSASTAITARYPGLNPDIHVKEIGKHELGTWYTDSPIPIVVSDEISIPVSSFLNDQGPGWEAYTLSVPAGFLQGLYWKYGDKLFSANIRGFLGSRNSPYDINNGIRLTLENEPQNFWPYNNGVTALVHDVSYDDGYPQYGELRICGLSIVNGAQTVGALNKFTDQDALSTARIAMRVVKCSDPAIVRKLIRYNNRQNVTEPEDFRSTDRVQRRIVTEFNHLGITSYTGGRRDVSLTRATRDDINVETASRALAAYHRMPGIAYNQKRIIWEEDRFYDRLFSATTSARHVLFCWSLLRAAERHKLWVCGLTESHLSAGKKEQREYFQRRGSIPLIVTAIADCMETILDRKITSSFMLQFSGNPSPGECISIWLPTVKSLAPLAYAQLEPLLGASGPPRELKRKDLQGFRNQVEVTTASDEERWRSFAERVELRNRELLEDHGDS